MEKNEQSRNPGLSRDVFKAEPGCEKTRGSASRVFHSGKVFLKALVFGAAWMGRKTHRMLKDLSLRIFQPRPAGEISPWEDIRNAFRHIPLKRRGWKYSLFGIGLAVYILSGLYIVGPGEEAVVRIFGKEVQQQIPEGLHYYLPWPLGAVEKVNVMEIRRVDLGVPLKGTPRLFPSKSSSEPPKARSETGGHGTHGNSPPKTTTLPTNPTSAKNQFLTGDENILEIRMNIQYRVKDASDYLFNLNRPDSLLSQSARAAITEIFGRMQVDDLLTVAKSQMQKMIARRTQRLLDEYRSGLHILSVNLQEVNPPREVAQAFRDVASAKEEREEKINKAQGYWNVLIPEARGKAQKEISNSEGYREEVINLAQGDAEKFLAMLREYQNNKKVTEYRLYLETMEKVLPKVKKLVVDSKKERVNLKFVK